MKAFQDNVRQSGPVAGASYSLVGAILLFGGLGYGFDMWRGTGPWGVVIGLMSGVVVGFYELVKTVWRK
jgi:F0F1-type ATP synthase assembly protein I